MGYLVFFAAVRGLHDLACLERIPATMPWRAFRVATCDLVLVEWLRRPNRNNPPPHNQLVVPVRPEFARRPAGVSLPERFGVAAPGLDDLYDKLLSEQRAGCLSKVAVQSALMLSEITDRAVLSVASDDEDWDLACEADKGKLAWLRFAAGDHELLFPSSGEVRPRALHKGHRILHHIAEDASTDWCRDLAPLFGFDGDAASVPLTEAARVNFVPEEPIPLGGRGSVAQPTERSSPRRPFWKLW